MSNAPETKESKLEGIKRNSRHLRGTLAETLASDTTHFSKDDAQLLKFHGSYQQDDRDVRHERRKQGEEEAWQFMVRCAIPGGIMTADQYLKLDELADVFANGSLRVTTRQGCQFHGVVKRDLKSTIRGVNECLLTTLAACGDVERNVMACPAPLPDAVHVAVRNAVKEIVPKLRPATKAYHEIWLNGDKVVSTADDEPFYGDVYLPRKFKTGVAVAGDNCIDVYSYDLGMIALVEGEKVAGYNVLVGGGMGMTHNKADTFAALGQPLGFVDADHVVEAAKIVAAIFRDTGNRADRRHARLKYVLAERGMDWFRDEFSRRALFPLQPWQEMPPFACDDHLGKQPQGAGRWFYGVFVANGRIKDDGDTRIKTALRDIVAKYQPGVRFTPHQNVLLTDLSEADIDAIENTLRDHGVTPAPELSSARRYSMACPALPTCGLAMSESERLMPTVVDRFEEELTRLGLRDEPITLRMTGCPNGCARPYTADIAFVGRRPDGYHVYVGGGLPGDRVADLYAADVATDDLVPTLRPLLEDWRNNRKPSESLSDYYQRLFRPNGDAPRQSVTGREEPTRPLVQLGVAS